MGSGGPSLHDGVPQMVSTAPRGERTATVAVNQRPTCFDRDKNIFVLGGDVRWVERKCALAPAPGQAVGTGSGARGKESQ